MEREVKALKEGKDNSRSQVEAIAKEITDAKNKQSIAENKVRAIESEIKLKGKQVNDLEGEIGNREKSNAQREQEKAKY